MMIDLSPDELIGGKWVQRRHILVWQPGPPMTHDLIACPTCYARLDEPCRSRVGRPTRDHESRLTPRRCPCGDMARERSLCRWCLVHPEDRVTRVATLDVAYSESEAS